MHCMRICLCKCLPQIASNNDDLGHLAAK
uniref:Uncharacterized protein n=1 Tax=Arundo donax TaxID=35708 RepID=A0A0A8YAY7_ARUDO